MTGPEPYLLGLRLAGRLVVVVGGGPVALRRASGLLAAGARVRVVAPALTPALDDLAARGLVEARRRPYADGDLDAAWLAFACTDQPAVNAAVAAEADRRRLWCGRADDAEAATAWVPATGRAGPVSVAVHAGRDPRRAAAARDVAVEAVARAAPPAVRPRSGTGRVVLVGGGPGDPGLITERGLRWLRAADVVVADRLAPLALLDDLPPGVRVVDAAKVPAGRAMQQEEINRQLVEQARAGHLVVRLKGGDPFVFGRGMEEVQACVAAGIPVEVVPGVSSAVAVPAAAGIPVTHRGASQAFTVVSGHLAPGDSQSTVDWDALARAGTTLVLLMAVRNLPAIAAALLAAGLPAATPVTAVADGGPPAGRVLAARLGEVPGGALAAASAPAVVVIGAVAALGHAGPPGAPAPAPAAPAAPDRAAGGPVGGAP